MLANNTARSKVVGYMNSPKWWKNLASLYEKLVLAFDIGTTRIKAGLVELSSFKVVSKASEKADIIYPRPGWAEVDPDKLWNQITRLSARLLEENKYASNNIVAIGFSAHMAGVLPLDGNYKPLRRIIIWLDERAAGLPRELWKGPLKIAGYNAIRLIEFLRITGGAPGRTGKDPLSKIVWIRENEPDIYNKTRMFIGVTGYLVLKTTMKPTMSPDEASLTWLADTRKRKASWCTKLLKRYGISDELLPPIRESISIAGYLTPRAANELSLEHGKIPVVTSAGDLAAAAIGSGAVAENEMHIYIGTSNWIAAHTVRRKLDLSNYIGSILSAIPGRYLLVAEQEVAGGALDWAMRLLGLEDKYSEVAELVEATEPGADGLVFAPWMYGERAPVDDPYLRGVLINMSFNHGKGEILRAIMEGVAFNIKWVFGPMERHTRPHSIIKATGGGCLFDIWCHILADVLEKRILRTASPQDATLRGVAMIAAVGLNNVSSFEEAAARIAYDREYKPDKKNATRYKRIYEVYKRLYGKLKELFRKLNTSTIDHH